MAFGLDNVLDIANGVARSKISNPKLATAFDLADRLYRRNSGPNNTIDVGIRGGRDILKTMSSRSDPLLNFIWYCELPLLPGFNRPLGWEFIEECTLPFINLEQKSYFKAGKDYHYPGKYSLETLNLKFYEDIQGTTTEYLQTWLNLIVDSATGQYQNPTDFKKTIKITLLDTASQTVMFFTYFGCWPMRRDSFNLASASSERVVISQEFSVDDVNVLVGKFSDAAIPSIVNNITSPDFQFPYGLSNLANNLPEAFSAVASFF